MRLVDALIDFVETGDGLKERFLAGFTACLAADRKSVENRGFGVAVRKVRCHRGEVGEGDFLLAERLAMHKGVESVFGFHVNCLGLGKPYWEKGVYLGDVLDFFDRHGETLIEKRAGSWHGDSTEVAKANECLQKGLAQFGLTLAQARERYGKREKARYRKWAETVAFFATDCSFLDIANLVDRSVAQVVREIHDTWYEDYMLGCIDYIASVAYHGGILLKPITTEKEITGHIGDTILSWCEKGQKDDGGNEFRD